MRIVMRAVWAVCAVRATLCVRRARGVSNRGDEPTVHGVGLDPFFDPQTPTGAWGLAGLGKFLGLKNHPVKIIVYDYHIVVIISLDFLPKYCCIIMI